MAKPKQLKVTLVRSKHGRLKTHRACVAGLGLRKLNQTVLVQDTPLADHAIPRARWSGGMHSLGEYEARYDGAVRKLDATLGRLFARLSRMGRLSGATICVVGTVRPSNAEGRRTRQRSARPSDSKRPIRRPPT